MSGGKGGGGSQRVTQETVIPEFLQPFVTQQAQVGSDALTALQSRLTGAGAADLVAPLNADQQMAIERARILATDPSGGLGLAQQGLTRLAQTGAGQGVGGDQLLATARGDFLFGTPQSQAAIDAAVRAAAPSILSTFGASGRGTGGLAQAAIAQQATDAFARQFGDERARQLGAAGQLSQQQLQAIGALPAASTAGINLLSEIGGQQQDQRQRELTAPISAIEALLQGAGGGIPLASILGSSQTSPTFSNPIGGAIGGGLLGLQLGGALSGGLGGGAIAPAAGGFLTGGGAASVGGAAGGAASGSWLGPLGMLGGALLGGLLS